MKTNDFQIAFCETNLRWLAGEPPSEERTQKEKFFVSEIERLKAENAGAKPMEGGECVSFEDWQMALSQA